MKRRTLLLGSASATALIAAGARSQRVYRLGVFIPVPGPVGESYLAVIRERLNTHGFVESRNLRIDARFIAYNTRPEIEVARELVAMKPDVILGCTTLVTRALQAADAAMPIVFTWVADPVASGFVKEYSQPRGNITGVTNRFFELAAKRIELVRELLPMAKRVAVVAGIFDSTLEATMKYAERAAERVNLQLFRVATGMNWSDAVPAVARGGAQAAVVMTPFGMYGMRSAAEEFVRRAIDQRMPAIYAESETVALGGLVSYSTNLYDDLRAGADMVARIFRGENPARLPVNQASRFEMALNLKTARAMDLSIPQSILARADRVIGAT